jgi:predicted dehydrogenase
MTNIAIGIIGAGLIGRKHLAEIATHPDFDFVGIADINAEQVAVENPAAVFSPISGRCSTKPGPMP